LQIARVAQAQNADAGGKSEEAGAAFLRGLIDAGEKAKVLDRVSGGRAPTATGS
jgi:hypothetical protein